MHSSKQRLQRGIVGIWTLVVLTSLACSSTPVVEDEPEIPEPTRMEIISEQTGLSIDALEAFEASLEVMDDEFSTAAALLEKAVELEPTFAEAHYNLGLLYGNMDRPDDAVVHIQQARQLDPDVFAYTVAMAKAFAEAGEYEDAKRLFHEVIARQPNNLVAKNNLAVISLRQGDEEEAMRFVEEILREDNDDVGALNTLGLIYMGRENVSLAKYVLGRALEEDEDHVDALNNLGLVYMQEDNVPAAVAAFSRAVEADPNFLESRLNLGAILIEYLDYDWADEQFTNAVRIAPQNCVANLGKGATSIAKAEEDAAYQHYRFYLDECDSDHVSSIEWLASLTQHDAERREEAIGYFKRLVAMSDDANVIANHEATIRELERQVEEDRQRPQEPEEALEVAEEEEVSEVEEDDEAQEP